MPQSNSRAPTTQVQQNPLAPQGTEPSLQFPTREYLEKNFHKPDLQKRCHELGLTKIWVTKGELINMILQKCQPVPQETDEPNPAPLSSGDRGSVPPPPGNPRPDPPPPGDPRSDPPPPGDPRPDPPPPGDPRPDPPPPSDPLPASLPPGVSRSVTTASDNPEAALPSTDEPRPASVSPVITQTASTPSDNTHTVSTTNNITGESDVAQIDVRKITKDIASIMTKLETKDLEIELLGTEIKTAYGIIEILQHRVNELEQQIHKSSKRCNQVADPPPTDCLLLGDTNLQKVLRSDLADTCSVRTITGANMDLLRSWVTEKLNRSPSDCVIYGGVYDILCDVAPEIILDNLGVLISDLKEKNTEMKIYVCETVPIPMSQEIQAKIDNYNEHLEKWCEKNGVTIIKTVSTFRLGTGDLDDLCFETAKDNVSMIFNRLGVIKLLGTIKKQCADFHLCSDWNNVKRKLTMSHNITQHKKAFSKQVTHKQSLPESIIYPFPPPSTAALASVASQPHHPPTRVVSRPPPTQGGTFQHPNSVVPHHLPPSTYAQAAYACPPPHRVSYPSSDTPVQRGASRPPPGSVLRFQNTEMAHIPPDYMPHNDTLRPRSAEAVQWGSSRGGGRGQQSTFNEARNDQHHSRDVSWRWRTDSRNFNSYHKTRDINRHKVQIPSSSYNTNYHAADRYKKVGCYNCGEFNHRQATCRFEHKVQCQQCYTFGHKSRLCSYYS